MKLRRVEIRGFKSFGKPTLLEFPEGISAIVGPNGSGKSNIIDAICFALGYPSRNLRATKAQELIHTGKLNVPHAKVSLVFQADDRVMEVKRKVDRKGRSVYKINSIVTNLENLHDVLSKYSIPKDGFNIVMQNDITKFIEIKPHERRRVLDEMSGIAGYEEKKKKALEELAVVERRISDTNLILSEKKGYLEEIGRDREIAIRYRDMQEELRTSRAVYLYSTLYDLENRAGELEARMEEVAKEKDIKIIELARIEEEIDDIEKHLEEITGNIIRTGGVESGEIKGEIGALKSAIEKKQEEIQFLKDEIASKEERQRENAKQQRELRARIKEHEESLKRLREEISGVEKALMAEEKEREKKTQEYDNSELIALEKERKVALESLFETKKSLMLIEKELDIIAKRRDEITESLGDRRKRLKGLKGELADMDARISKLGIEVERIEKAGRSLEETKSKLSKLFQEFARLESEIKTIERMEARVGESESLRFVLKHKDKGYIGQVSELGRSPEKYRVALEAAAGNKSGCLVVKDDKAAEFYIEGLRKNKIGRATFLPLNRIHGPKLRQIKGKGVIGYAKDLIKCERKYQKVFDLVFGDTLVVEDIEAARRVGIGKIRMVTLNGDLISAGGAMTGGYYKKSVITFSSISERKKRLEEVKREIASLKERKERLERQLEGKGTSSLDVMRERRANILEKIETVESEIAEFEKELSELSSQEKELDEKKVRSEKDIARKEKELRGIEGKMDVGALDKMKGILQEIDNKIHDLRDHKFELQSRENAIIGEIRSLESKIKDLEVQTDEINTSISKFRDKIREGINQITQSGKKLKELEEKHSIITAESQGLFKEQERLNQLLKELGEKKGIIEASVERLKNEYNELEVKKAKTDAKLEEIRAGLEGIEPPPKEQMEGANIPELRRRIRQLESELGSIDGVNLRAVDMYEELEKQYNEIKEKNQMLYIEKEKIYDLIETIEEKKRAVFYDVFNKVRENFTRIISELYPTSEGSLRLENEADPFNSGLLIEIKPRGREGIGIDSLSGGEKTLTALAFLMAMQSVTPSPFYILDEVDASLDQENVLRLTRFLKNRKQSQFILISHNPETVKHMDSVIGVHMQDGLSRVVGVRMQEAEA